MPTQTSSLTNGGYFAEDPVNKTSTKPAHADSHDAGDVKCAETKRFTIDEVNALNRRIADTWTPEMDEEIERMSRQDRLTRCAKLTEKS
ncbi:Uncharacterised protein [Burkholderia pseudomallei]|nr:Uncharacterised protein [Burkholderia pseudomallei]CAJ7616568.1 Uncharacterised protein [Burkholderia pseudomallei]